MKKPSAMADVVDSAHEADEKQVVAGSVDKAATPNKGGRENAVIDRSGRRRRSVHTFKDGDNESK